MAEKRGNLLSYDPITDVAIASGQILPDDERGDLDTAEDESDPLHDRRLYVALVDPFVRNVDAFGVHTPIVVRKRNGIPFVIAGRRRLRAARRVNRERTAKGQPPMRIEARLESGNDVRLMGIMFGENANRMNDDFASTVENIRGYIARGVDIADAALAFGIEPARAESWIEFDDNAIDVVKDAVLTGRMSVSAGIEIVRAGDAANQTATYDALVADGALTITTTSDATPNKSEKPSKVTVRQVRQVAKRVTRGASDLSEGIGDKRTQKRILQAIQDKSHGKASEKTLAFWEGAENMLALIIGGDGVETEVDSRLVEMAKEVRKVMRKESK